LLHPHDEPFLVYTSTAQESSSEVLNLRCTKKLPAGGDGAGKIRVKDWASIGIC